jgi:hypothetical protein
MQYEVKTGTDVGEGLEPQGFGFDGRRNSMANGAVVARDEVRLLQPFTDGNGQIQFRMVRSPVAGTMDIEDVSIVLTDRDGDGNVEIIGGRGGPDPMTNDDEALFRVKRGR